MGTAKNQNDLQSKIEKVPRGIQSEKSSKSMVSSRNLVSTIGESLLNLACMKFSDILIDPHITVDSKSARARNGMKYLSVLFPFIVGLYT